MFPHIQLAMVEVLAEQYADQDCIVHFDYISPCGKREKIRVHYICKVCTYMTAPGKFADWHGRVAEKWIFDPNRVDFEGDQTPCHELLFQNLDKVFGMDWILFSQVGPSRWSATHQGNVPVVLDLRLPHTIAAETRPLCVLPANHRTPVSDEAVTPPTPSDFEPWEFAVEINKIVMNNSARDSVTESL